MTPERRTPPWKDPYPLAEDQPLGLPKNSADFDPSLLNACEQLEGDDEIEFHTFDSLGKMHAMIFPKSELEKPMVGRAPRPRTIDQNAGTHFYQVSTRVRDVDWKVPPGQQEHRYRVQQEVSIGPIVFDPYPLESISLVHTGGPDREENFYAQLINRDGYPLTSFLKNSERSLNCVRITPHGIWAVNRFETEWVQISAADLRRNGINCLLINQPENLLLQIDWQNQLLALINLSKTIQPDYLQRALGQQIAITNSRAWLNPLLLIEEISKSQKPVGACEKCHIPDPKTIPNSQHFCTITSLAFATGREDILGSDPDPLSDFQVAPDNHNYFTYLIPHFWVSHDLGRAHLRQAVHPNEINPSFASAQATQNWQTARSKLLALPKDRFTLEIGQLDRDRYRSYLKTDTAQKYLTAALVDYRLWSPGRARRVGVDGNVLVICDFDSQTDTVFAFEPTINQIVEGSFEALYQANTAKGQQLISLYPS